MQFLGEKMATKVWLADFWGWRPQLGYSGSVTFMHYPLIRYFL